MMKIALLVAAMAAATSAATYNWNGASRSIGDKKLWSTDGDGKALAPSNDDADGIKGLAFGQDGLDSKLVVPVASGSELHSGLKITFNSATKLVLGDGKGTSKLIFDGKKNGATLTYIPGSGTSAEVKLSGEYDHTTDVMCHTNWATAGGDTIKPLENADGTYTYVGPCDGDTVNFDNSAKRWNLITQKEEKKRPPGGIIFAQLLGDEKRFFKTLKIGNTEASCDEETDQLKISEADSENYQLDLGTCGTGRFMNYQLGGEAKAKSCASTCPPAMVMPDGKSVVDMGDGEYAIVDKDGKVVEQKKGNAVKATTGEDGKVTLDVELVGDDGEPTKFQAKVDPASKEAPKPVAAVTTTAAPTTMGEGETTKKQGGGGGKPDDDDDDDDDENDDTVATTPAGGDAEKSSGDKKKDDDSSGIIIIIVVIVVLLLVAIIVIVVVIKVKGGNTPGDRSVVSFENPMYDTQGNKQNPVAGMQAPPQASGGYQDVSPQQGMEGTYAEPFDDHQQQASSGYMDVQGTGGGGAGASTGYMDVAPGAAGTTGYMDVAPGQTMDMGDDDDDGEDV